MSPTPTPDQAEAGRAFVAQHEAAARYTGETYADALFTVMGGREPPAGWFDERLKDFGRSFGEFYGQRGDVDRAFAEHMLNVATRAMFDRLAELIDQAPPSVEGRVH